jgi:type I restriction enzyme M protein
VLSELQAELDATSSQMSELEEEHNAEGAAFADLDKVNDKEVKAQIKKLALDVDVVNEVAVLKQWLTLSDKESELKKTVKALEADLDQKAFDQYAKLTDADMQQLVVQDKWLATMQGSLQAELDRVSQTLTSRIRELAERYATPLPMLTDEVEELSAKVGKHLKRMGVVWN